MSNESENKNKKYDAKYHAERLQHILNMVVAFMDVRTLRAFIDHYVELEADEGDYTDVFRVLDIALTDWLNSAAGDADETYVQQAERVKMMLTMTRDERGELFYAEYNNYADYLDKPHSRFNHSSKWDKWDFPLDPFLEEEHNLTKADALEQIKRLRQRHRLE